MAYLRDVRANATSSEFSDWPLIGMYQKKGMKQIYFRLAAELLRAVFIATHSAFFVLSYLKKKKLIQVQKKGNTANEGFEPMSTRRT